MPLLNLTVDSTDPLSTLQAQFESFKIETEDSINSFFILSCGFLVFLMQAGFALLTAGSVSVRNVKNAIMKNLFDACVGGLAFWIFGYAFSSGTYSSILKFIGSGNFALTEDYVSGYSNDLALHDFFFQWTFAATSATIVSGSVAERTTFWVYLACAFLINAWVFPVAAHWVWNKDGFLRNLYGPGDGMIDFAGCTVVHIVGGFAGLVGSILVGARRGRFDEDGNPTNKNQPHSAPLSAIGTFLLWFGWYGFNAGSTGKVTDGYWIVAERCAISTTIAAVSGGLTTLLIKLNSSKTFNLQECLNGVLAGLVSITASCAFVEPYAAFIIAAVGAIVYYLSTVLLLKFKIDDPLDAFPIHGAAGIWGAVAPGFFNREKFQALHGEYKNMNHGLLYRGGVKLLGANLAGVACVITWTVINIAALFLFIKYVLRLAIRVPPSVEEQGNDIPFHDGPAYPYFELGEIESPSLPDKK